MVCFHWKMCSIFACIHTVVMANINTMLSSNLSAPDTAIRPYQPADKPGVIALLRANTPLYFAPEEESELVFYLENETEEYFVVETEKGIIGCGGINFEDHRRTGKLSWDIIHPDYQGKGVGRLLLKHRISKLKSIKEVEIISVRTSQMAFRFYEKCGFELLEIKKDYWAEGFDLYLMEYSK